ncbi:MAG TPA: site-specific integrase [Solirubrobacterales bacterium]|nr:site-specific integrase [Solirubrobacterales bacterium]
MSKSRSKVRRPPGSGHLQVRKTKAGHESWYGKWRTPDGRQVMKKIGPKRDRSGRGLDRTTAEKKLREMIGDTPPPPESRVSVGEAGRLLVENRVAMGRKTSTTYNYRSVLRTHINPYFDGISIHQVTRDQVESFMGNMSRKGKSPKTIRNALAVLHSIFEFSQKKGWASSNPVRWVDKPVSEANIDIRFLNFEEIESVITAAKDDDDELATTFAMAIRIAAMTGLRQGEVIGLRWGDIDWTAGKVRVRQSYVRREFTTPKSRRSSRSVPLADVLGTQLDWHFKESAWDRDDDLVVAHPVTGHPIDASKLRKHFKQALKSAGVREVRFHDLRHSFGTKMAAAGVPMRTLQEWMGHRDIQTTMIYADYAPSAHEREWVDSAFAKSTHDIKTSALG